MTIQLEKKFRVRYHEINHQGCIRVSAIQYYLQEAALEHASFMGIDMQHLKRKHLTWVLVRNHIKLFRPPRFGEELIVRTWPSGRNDFFARREFELLNMQKECLGVATTSWMVVDLYKRKPIRIADIVEGIPVNPKRTLVDDFRPLPKLRKSNLEKRFFVRLSDLDLNQHVNNVSYLQWCMEAIPQETWKRSQVMEWEMNYRAEVFYGDVVISRSANENPHQTFLHQLLREDDGRELARARTRWESSIL